MAYIDRQSSIGRPQVVAGVVIVHALIGYVLIVGLAPGLIDLTPPNRLEGTNIEIKLPPPPPKPETKPDQAIRDSVIFTPRPPIDFEAPRPPIGEINLPPLDREIVLDPKPRRPIGEGTETRPTPVPTVSPLAAHPRNAPGSWVTTADYRTSWINRELTGTARFELTVGVSGRVEACRITASSGHAALDEATCALVTRRARFEPARDNRGEKVAGSYASSIRWELPE